MPLVTVVIPAFNAEPFIAESIHSALDQSAKDLEVIVVDNGSTDRTVEIVSQFHDPRVRVLTCDKAGAAAARNMGLRSARGYFVQFLDADDVLHTEKIALQLAALEGCSGRTLASCSWLRFDKRVDEAQCLPEPVWTAASPIEWLVCSLNGGGMMQTAGWLTPRQLIDAAGPWDESLSLHDDGEFFTRVLLQADRQVFVPNALVYYRSRAGSLSRQRSRGAIESAFRVCELRDRHLLGACNELQVREAIATQYLQFAYEFSSYTPDLATRAVARIGKLGVRPRSTVGGRVFRAVSMLVGYRAALFLRGAARTLRATSA